MGCGGRRREDSVDDGEGGKNKNKIYVAKSFSLSVVDWFHVAGLYVPYILSAALVLAISFLVPASEMKRLAAQPEHALHFVNSVWGHVSGLWYAYAIIAACVYYGLTSKPSVYLMDFAVFESPFEWRVSRAQLVEIMQNVGAFTPESISFMTKLLNSSGTGEATAWPPGTVRLLRKGEKDETTGEIIEKADTSLAAARSCATTVLIGCMESLVARTGLKPKDVDYLIINCSLFCPTPSLCAIIAKRFGMKSTLKSYNLGGMGCSASVISIDLAKQLLQNDPHSLAVVLSTEEISQSLYTGNERSMLVQNTLFRVGGAAMLLSNKPMDGFRAKYKLLYTVRVQDGSENGHGAVRQQEDACGTKGIFLSKDITVVAGKALKMNLTILGSQVLPLREQLKVVASIAWRKASAQINAVADSLKLGRVPFTADGRIAMTKDYVPDFKTAIRHFCIHAGGRAVIDGIEENLSLARHHTAPSRATLFHWGNTSSSSIWYELRYCEGEKSYWSGVPDAALAHRKPDGLGTAGSGSKGSSEGSSAGAASSASTAGSSSAASTAGGAGAASEGPKTPARNRASSGTSSGPATPASTAAAGILGTTPSALAATPSKGSASSASGSASGAAGHLQATESGAGAGAVSATQPTAVTSEAVPEGWDPARKWHLPDYEGRHVVPGDRVLQIAFGSGFKCNSAVWLRLK